MTLLSVDAAFELVVGGVVAVTASEALPLRRAAGRVLASDLRALRTQPPFDASAMDGYAVPAADVVPPFHPLRIAGESAAGRAFGGALRPGEAVRIFTGAPLPAGADAILIQENADRIDGGCVKPKEVVVAGRHIRRAGADFATGAVLVKAGTRLGAGQIALAASGGHPVLDVLVRPRVAILATGSELVLPGEPIGPSQIVASNTFGVAALVEAAGGEAIDYGIAPDDETSIVAHLDRAVGDAVDVLVTIGGVSVGDHDLVGKVFASRNASLDFWKVAMRPGKPLMAGRIGGTRLIGLPGNPASSLVTATLFLKPLVAALAGNPKQSPYRDGVLGMDMPANDERAEFVRAIVDESDAVTPIVTAFRRQDSSLLSVYGQANALLLRPAHAEPARTGDPCRFIRLD